jgi:hypothetical protein
MSKLSKKAKKIIKWIAWGIGIIIAVILGKKLADLKLFDRNDEKKHWSMIPGKEDEIMMETEPGTWEAVKLPKDVKADDIKSAGISKTDGKIKVEIKHETTDRRNVTDVSGSAYDELRETDGDGS